GPGSIGESDGPFQRDQPPLLGAGDPVPVDRPVGGRIEGQAQRHVPQRPRAEDRPLHTVDLPVEPRIRFAEEWVTRLMGQHELPGARALQGSNDLLELDRQLGLESTFDVSAEQSRKERAGCGQGEQDPDDRADEQPESEGIDSDHPGSSSRYPRPRTVLMTLTPSLRRSRATKTSMVLESRSKSWA